MSTADVRIQVRYDTASAWSAEAPLLRPGELGVETDTSRAKIGDGQRLWSELPYVGAEFKQAIDGGTFYGGG
jgi:hypothetical protein